MLRVLVMVSGGGTNLQAIIDGVESGAIRNTKLVGVLSNNKKAYALERAQQAGIAHFAVSPKDYPERAQFNQAWLDCVDACRPDLIVLAGCLVIQPPELIRRYPNRIINLHPSLIPSFCGKGCYGLAPHRMALARGVRVTGATVHFVDEGTDTGPILLQEAVRVRQDDTPETLQRRVMEEAEWKILPRAIDLIAAGRVRVADGRAYVEEE